MALPSASARIRGMEEMSGVSLLDRGARGVRVTPAGRPWPTMPVSFSGRWNR